MTVAEARQTPESTSGPPRKWVAVTFDTAPSIGGQAHVFRGIYNGAASAKDIAVTNLDGTDITIPDVPAGHIIPGFFLDVNTTGTTALATELRGLI
jgi:hypothetical protein